MLVFGCACPMYTVSQFSGHLTLDDATQSYIELEGLLSRILGAEQAIKF